MLNKLLNKKKNRIAVIIAIPTMLFLATVFVPLSLDSTSFAALPTAQSNPKSQNIIPTQAPVLPAHGSISKHVPYYHTYPPTTVLTVPSDGFAGATLTLYKLCDGPNLVYLTTAVGNAYQSGSAAQVQFDSPECR